MKKEMLINVLQPEECRIAIIEDGVLEELYVERTSHESYTGNIYKGRIVNLEPAIQAAFVDFSVGRNGFLHVSDIEPQYFDRNPPGPDAPDAPDRDRRRERGRDRDRGRGRDDRRRPPASPLEPINPPPGLPPSVAPPRIEERPRERPRERDRDRDRERGRERERPDQSLRGRRDRSEPPPRRFGEGLVEPGELPVDPPVVLSQPPLEPQMPFAVEPPEILVEQELSAAPAWPVSDEGSWDEDLLRRSTEELLSGQGPELGFEEEPFGGSRGEPFGGSLEIHEERVDEPFGFIEPFDPDLPPSRTQRPRGSSRPGDVEGPDRGRSRGPAQLPAEPDPRDRTDRRPRDGGAGSPPGREPRRPRGRGRGRSPDQPGRALPPQSASDEVPFGPEIQPMAPEDRTWEPDLEDIPRTEEPPTRRGGRAAIRSRGGEWDREGAAPAGPSPARGHVPPGETEIDRGRGTAPDRPGETERQRAQGPPEAGRDRDRMPPHGRAGEPGYVPRRERLRSGDSAFGADIFPSGAEWTESGVEPGPEREIDPRAAELHEDDDSGFPAEPGVSDAARSDPRRRRGRRRGRRRERPRSGPASTSPPSPADELEADDDLGFAADSSRPFDRDDESHEDALGDFDDFGPEDTARVGHDALDEDDFAGIERTTLNRGPADEEIDSELEQEIRREIDEIEELEREMGLRAPADSPGRRGDEPARGARSPRGRGPVKPPIQEIFRRGDEVLVQVIKESIGTKGPTLSTYISIPGRYLVLMPGLNRVGVSRKIVDEGQRRKLREIMNELNPPKGLGFIVRTAGLERTKRELARDLAYLLRLWKVILRRIKKSKAPTPIYQESDMIIRTIRDIFNSEIDTIWIDEPSAFERAQDFLRIVMPRFVSRLKLYDEKVPLFHRYGIEDEIAKIQRRHVPLPEGGSIVIDQTEALVAIDVNSGNFRVEDDAERTAYEMNLRAAKEIARQLRLRDLGGVIVNDFIDMREERHSRGVERALREAIKRDRARTKILRMSAFGLIEMTRQRIRPSLKRSIYEDCRHCGGAGVAKTAESMAIDVMRLLALATHREEIRRIVVTVHPHVATYLSNRKRKQIAKFEAECNMTIQVGFGDDAPAEHLKIECYDANGNEVRPFPQPASAHKRAH
jgi:ribonuclease E